ncbi:MAG TPA: DUF87 domain-containing protein [Candidatus Saccharimonadales bacterium]|nr:DUF87 domain-containing protein [Candidatus Saccharimonadales bacterium]
MDTVAPEAAGSVLLLQVPRTNDKKALAAEQMFASLQGLLVQPAVKFYLEAKRETISFEMAVINKRIAFYLWVPTYLKEYVAEQVYAQYPTVQISEVEDYVAASPDYTTTLTTDMHLTQSDVLPIKTFQSFEVDPLAAITATLAKFNEDEEAWLQLAIRPAHERWHQKNERYLAKLKGGHTNMTGLLQALWAPPEHKVEAAKLNEYQQLRAKGAETKGQKLAYECVLRIVYRGNVTKQQAQLRLQSIAASYKQFNSTYLNGFAQGRTTDARGLIAYKARDFSAKSFVMNIEEVATLFHLPHTNVETPYILWASAQTAEPPANLPLLTDKDPATLSPIAITNFRGHNIGFGLPRSDRGRHLYILGQTGVGKSGLLELLTISDIYSPYGFAIIDPHGDYAQNILKRIPADRIKDVVYFNAADTDFPVAFNPLEVYDEKLKSHTCSELIGVLKRLFESWGPRLEYILRYSILALLDYPNATMLDITRILTDRKFRDRVLTYVKDPVVLNFWTVEFASWNDKFATEAVAPVLNKVGAFTANPLVRNIIGQPKSSFNIRQIMDERKILIVNLSRGLVGEDNAALLGALIVTKVQMAAMSRADIELEDRVPFQLYVDEFQNFATDSFATILSEARKYGLCLTVANQYVAQMMPTVKDAVFGNVGSIVAFRMSADDARTMQRYFEPKFSEYDLIHMHNRHFTVSMTIDGEKSQAFSGITLDLPAIEQDNSRAIVEASRYTYGTARTIVDTNVGDQYQQQVQSIQSGHTSSKHLKKHQAPKPKAQPRKPAPKVPLTASAQVEKILRIPLSLLTKPKESLVPVPATPVATKAPNPAPATSNIQPAPVAKPVVVDDGGLIFSRSMHMAPAQTAPLPPIKEIQESAAPQTEEPVAPAKRKRRRRRSKSKKPADVPTE